MFRITVLCAGEQTQGWRLHSAMLILGDMLRPSEGLWVIVWEWLSLQSCWSLWVAPPPSHPCDVLS